MSIFKFVAVLFLTLFLPVAPSSAQEPMDAAFERGIDAYRRGAYAEAETVWTTLFESEGLTDTARARVAFDLGNVAWRTERRGDAIGWYTVAVRLAPRWNEAWRNLEFARAELGLEPYDRGDLRSTGRRLMTSLRAAERRNLALAGLTLLALLGVAEALLGGATLRRLFLMAAVLAVLSSLPWVCGLAFTEESPMLVVAERAPKLRSEPSTDRGATAELVPGELVERLDELAGWVRVEAHDDRRGWVPADSVFALGR